MSSYFEHIPYKQDQAPRGGYPEIEYRRHLPRRGLSGVAMIAAGVGVMMGGFWITAKANQKRRELKKEKLEARRNILPIIQAEADRRKRSKVP